jgi:pimeloyl-ACP methyl ester carboxylesterase
MLAGYADHPTPYLALFGIDPGPGYAEWLARRVPGAVVETWEDHGHYPHLVDPDRFVDRIVAFWAGSTGG